MRQPIQVLVYPVRGTNSGREYLMLRRTASRGGFWQGVTGGVEEGEEVLEAAKRELAEETGFILSGIQRIDYAYRFPVADEWRDLYAEDVKEITEYVFVAYVDGQPDPILDPREHDTWEWCSFDRALALLTWPGNIEALKRCDNFLRGHESSAGDG